MMTKTDYEAIARAIRARRDRYAPHWDPNLFRACDDLSRAVADACATRDPQFKQRLFLEQCGVVDRATEAAQAGERG